MNEVLRIGVRALRGNLSGYLRQVEQGASILVTARGKVIAELRPPPAEKQPPRLLGAMRGKIWMAPDFNEWPEDILDAMEGKDDEVSP